jgi:hypothetical protein
MKTFDFCSYPAPKTPKNLLCQSIAEQAEVFFTYVRARFWKLTRDEPIVLTRTEITDTYAHNASRRSDSPVSDIYERCFGLESSWALADSALSSQCSRSSLKHRPPVTGSVANGDASSNDLRAESFVIRALIRSILRFGFSGFPSSRPSALRPWFA